MSVSLPPRCAEIYRVVRTISSGSFGTVLEAEQLKLGRLVALKLLHRAGQDDPGMVERFLAEARITAGLTHPHVVRVLDFDVENGTPWIAYELMPGGTLANLLEDGPLPWPTACRLAAQVASALEAAHAQGVLHRDIKTTNVLDAGSGNIKVTDFGLAKSDRGEAAALTGSGVLMGSPGYMAPELIEGEKASVASDVYATGVLLYELLTTRLPYSAPTLGKLLLKHVQEAIPSVRALVPAVPAAVDAIVTRTLAKVPAERFAGARELRLALEALIPADLSLDFIDRSTDALPLAPTDLVPPASTRPRAPAPAGRASRVPVSTRPSAVPPVPGPLASRASPVGGALLATGLLLAAGVLVVARWPARIAPVAVLPPAASASPVASEPPAEARALDLADRARMRAALTRAHAMRQRHATLAEVLGQTDNLGTLVGIDESEVRTRIERIRAFREHHRSIGAVVEPALSELRTLLPDLSAAPFEDLILYTDLLSTRTVVKLQQGRADHVLELLERERSVSTLTALGSSICYGTPELRYVHEFFDVCALALSRVASRPPPWPELFPRVLSELRWVATYFVHYPICGLTHAATERRLAERLAGLKGFPATPDGERLHRLAVDVVVASLKGGSAEARRAVVPIVTTLEELRQASPGAKPEIDRLELNLRTEAGEKP